MPGGFNSLERRASWQDPLYSGHSLACPTTTNLRDFDKHLGLTKAVPGLFESVGFPAGSE